MTFVTVPTYLFPSLLTPTLPPQVGGLFSVLVVTAERVVEEVDGAMVVEGMMGGLGKEVQ